MGFKEEYKIQSLFSPWLNYYFFNKNFKKRVNLPKTQPLPTEFLIVQNKDTGSKVLSQGEGKDLRAPKDAHFESQALCIGKKILRALFVFPKLSESKRGLNRQVLAAKSLIFIRSVSDVVLYILLSWV